MRFEELLPEIEVKKTKISELRQRKEQLKERFEGCNNRSEIQKTLDEMVAIDLEISSIEDDIHRILQIKRVGRR